MQKWQAIQLFLLIPSFKLKYPKYASDFWNALCICMIYVTLKRKRSHKQHNSFSSRPVPCGGVKPLTLEAPKKGLVDRRGKSIAVFRAGHIA